MCCSRTSDFTGLSLYPDPVSWAIVKGLNIWIRQGFCSKEMTIALIARMRNVTYEGKILWVVWADKDVEITSDWGNSK